MEKHFQRSPSKSETWGDCNQVGTVTSGVAGDDVETFDFWINRLFTRAVSVRHCISQNYKYSQAYK